MTLFLAAATGALIGLSLGALGAGGSILAVPGLVYLLDQGPVEATTGSLVMVAVTAAIGAAAARSNGTVLIARGLGFGLVAVGGAAVGARAAARVPASVLLAAFSVVLLIVGGLMILRQVRRGRGAGRDPSAARPTLDDPIITVRPAFLCDCPRALTLLVTATGVGLLTGFLGVGGGFLVVPALVLVFALPMELAVGTSLVAIAVTSTAALGFRVGTGLTPDWPPVVVLTAAAVVGVLAGGRLARRLGHARLAAAFTAVVLAVAGWAAVTSLPALT